MNDFEMVRDGIGWSDDSLESDEAYAAALATLDRIEAEVERLRAALAQIADLPDEGEGGNDIARAALAKEEA